MGWMGLECFPDLETTLINAAGYVSHYMPYKVSQRVRCFRNPLIIIIILGKKRNALDLCKVQVTVGIGHKPELLRSAECHEPPGLGLDLTGADILRFSFSGTIYGKKLFSSEQSVIKYPVEVRQYEL